MGTQAIREKFINLRKRLDQLGYKQPLIWTTESLRNAKSELLSQFKLRSNIEDYVSAYKADNGRLIRDNNDLHRHLLALRQDIEEKMRAFDAKYRRSEGENKDLKLFNSQCMEKIKEYEVTTKRMTEQLTLLQDKNSQAVMHTPGKICIVHVPFGFYYPTPHLSWRMIT
ncbi:unnamed protein product [Dicrocoelium dendriticum]|nr:unnamed protein product [Dicrocoelium dendriticum]